ncbi:MAG: SGNH/GDSL hydrolase family protein [Marmoricola sp.]
MTTHLGRFARYVALGDSQTEGLNDGDPEQGYRGWADRFADQLAEVNPDLVYANLAVRGCRARHVRHHQLPAALALEPDLASVVVGMNDMLRHDYDLEETVREVEETFEALVSSGATVLTMTFPNVARMLPMMGWLLPRQRMLNARITAAAGRHGVPVLDLFTSGLTGDPRIWSHDRIHGSTLGHTRIASGAAELVGLPGSDGSWTEPIADPVADTLFDVLRREVHWAATFVVPFLHRQLTGRSSGTGRTAKRPLLELVRGSALLGQHHG